MSDLGVKLHAWFRGFIINLFPFTIAKNMGQRGRGVRVR